MIKHEPYQEKIEEKSKYFLLYSHSQIVTGKEKSAIYDLKNSRVIYIPNILVEVLNKLRTFSIQEVKEVHTPGNKDILDQYIDFLLNNDLGFLAEDPEFFPKMKMTYEYPGEIREAVIETDLKSYNLETTLRELHTLGCRYLELRVNTWNEGVLKDLQQVFEHTSDFIFVSISLLITDGKDVNVDELSKLYSNYPKIRSIKVFDSADEVVINSHIMLTATSLEEEERLSMKKNRLIVNLSYYSESLQFNPTYHLKVSINQRGYIKNILLDQHHYGKIQDISLSQIVRSREFQKLWYANADKISEIRNCPLRYAYFYPFPLEENSIGNFRRVR